MSDVNESMLAAQHEEIRRLREREAELEEALLNIAAHVDDCQNGFIPASDLAMEVHFEIEDLRARDLLEQEPQDD